jgi:hypothetical protein
MARMRKNLTAMTLEQHEEIASALLLFLKTINKNNVAISSAFSENTQTKKKLAQMFELGNFLKYSLQQAADLHITKVSKELSEDEIKKWKTVYLK